LTATSEYYLGFFKNWQGNGNLLVMLVNTISTPANFTIEAPGVGFQQTGVVNGDSDAVISLPNDLTVVTTNEINEGIYLKIYSNDVLVFGQNEQSSTSDTFFALPYQRLANAAKYVYSAMSAPWIFNRFPRLTAHSWYRGQYQNEFNSNTNSHCHSSQHSHCKC